MINLCLVVIATQFSETKKRETERMLQERKRFNSSSTLASNSEPGGCYKEMLKYLGHLWRRGRRKLMRKIRQHSNKRLRKVTPEKAISLRRKRKRKKSCNPHLQHQLCQQQTIHLHHHHHHHFIHHYPVNSRRRGIGASPLAPRASPEISELDLSSSPRRPNCLKVPGDAKHSSSESLSQSQTMPLGTATPPSQRPPILASPAPLGATAAFTGLNSQDPSTSTPPASHNLMVPGVQPQSSLPVPRCIVTPGSPIPSVSRTSSFNSGSGGSGSLAPPSPVYPRRQPSPSYVPEVVATYAPRHSYAASNRLSIGDGNSPRRPKLNSLRGMCMLIISIIHFQLFSLELSWWYT